MNTPLISSSESTTCTSPHDSLEIGLLGGLTVHLNGIPLPRLRSRQGYRLLALLALRHGRPVERDFLASELWPDSDRPVALGLLRRSLTDLRKAMGAAEDRLRSPSRHALQLDFTPPDRLDIAEFEASAGSSDSAELDRAISLYRGPLLVSYSDEWAELERHRLTAIYEAALERRQELLRQNDETARRNAAPAVPETKSDVPKRIDGGLRGSSSIASLPVALTRFIGRAAEMSTLQTLLAGDDAVLVTITGAGGSGKTRLAIEVARTLVPNRFSGGAVFLSLSDLSSPHLIPQALARLLGVPLAGTPSLTERIISYLGSGPSRLIVIDNCEHLLIAPDKGSNGVADFIRELRERVPSHVAFLATSQAPLQIDGESRFSLQPLPLSGGGDEVEKKADISPSDSTVLYLDRSREANHRLIEYGPADSRAVAEICRMLDGLPLAIEIAASWSAVLSPSQIRQRLDKRRDALTARRKTSLERHLSLKSLLEWSYELLNPEQKFVLRSLSVFRGSWNIEAVENICSNASTSMPIASEAVLGIFAELQDRSLIAAGAEHSVNSDDGDTEMRFRLLETVREFALGKLAADQPHFYKVHDTHAAYFAGIAAENALAMRGEKQAHAAIRFDREVNNLRAAMEWYQSDNDGSERFLSLCAGLSAYWEARGTQVEGFEWMSAALAKSASDSPTLLRAGVLTSAGGIAWQRTDYPTARLLYEEARSIALSQGESGLLANLLSSLANVTYYEGDHDSALVLYEESLALAREIDDLPRVALALGNLGVFALRRQDSETALLRFQEQLAIRRRISEPGKVAITLGNLATSLRALERNAEAREAFSEAESIFRSLGFRTHLPYVLRIQGMMARDSHDYERARKLLCEAAVLEHESDLMFDLRETLLELIVLECALPGREIYAAQMIGTVEAMKSEPPQRDESRLATAREKCAAALGLTVLQDAIFRGRLFAFSQAIKSMMVL